MATLLEEVGAAVEELFAGQVVRWPGGLDIHAELEAVWNEYPLLTAATVAWTVLRLVDEVGTLAGLVDAMYREGISRGQRGDGATCRALLDLADRIEEWRADG
jgi:hypothetical protein